MKKLLLIIAAATVTASCSIVYDIQCTIERPQLDPEYRYNSIVWIDTIAAPDTANYNY